MLRIPEALKKTYLAVNYTELIKLNDPKCKFGKAGSVSYYLSHPSHVFRSTSGDVWLLSSHQTGGDLAFKTTLVVRHLDSVDGLAGRSIRCSQSSSYSLDRARST